MIDKELLRYSSRDNFHPLNHFIALELDVSRLVSFLPLRRHAELHTLHIGIWCRDKCAYETILHFYGDFRNSINWKISSAYPHLRCIFAETRSGTLTPRIIRNFITEHFTVLKRCAPSVTELFNGRNSIKAGANPNLKIVWQRSRNWEKRKRKQSCFDRRFWWKLILELSVCN